MLIISNKLSMSPLEYRIALFQSLINDHDKYYRIMNFNLDIILDRFRKGNGKYIKPTKRDIINYLDLTWFY
jgi:hypothetical protein